MKPFSFENIDETIRLLGLIRQVLPRDPGVLTTLCEVHKQAGQFQEAGDVFLLLVRTVLAGGQPAAAQSLLFMSSQMDFNRPELDRLMGPLNELAGGSAARETRTSLLMERGSHLGPQLNLLWKIYGIGEIERHEYMLLLEQMVSQVGTTEGPLSALHTMEEAGMGDASRTLQVLSAESGMPAIDLDGFTLTKALLNRLPPEFWRSRGVMVFGELVDQPMVVVLSPGDEHLVAEVQEVAGSRCHFYVTPYTSYKKALSKAEMVWNAVDQEA